MLAVFFFVFSYIKVLYSLEEQNQCVEFIKSVYIKILIAESQLEVENPVVTHSSRLGVSEVGVDPQSTSFTGGGWATTQIAQSTR